MTYLKEAADNFKDIYPVDLVDSVFVVCYVDKVFKDDCSFFYELEYDLIASDLSKDVLL